MPSAPPCSRNSGSPVSDKIAHLRDKFDHAFSFFRLDEKCPNVHRDHNRRFAAMKNCPLHRLGTLL